MTPTKLTLRFMSLAAVALAVLLCAYLLCSTGITGSSSPVARRSEVSHRPPIDVDLARKIDEFLLHFRSGRSCIEPDPNRLFHALRCYPGWARWSREGDGCWSISATDTEGAFVLDVLLNSDRFLRNGGRDPVIITRGGAPSFAYSHSEREIRTGVGQSHPNQFLFFLAELEVPEDYPVSASKTERWTLRDLVASARQNVVLGQGQLSWTVPALAHYVGFDQSWTNKYGDRISVPTLLDSLIENSDDEIYCARTHYAHALAFSIRECRRQGHEVSGHWLRELDRLVVAAVKNQGNDGSWKIDWLSPTRGEGTSKVMGYDKGDDLNVTGHMLEWLCLCTESDSRPPSIAARAAAWLLKPSRDLMETSRDFLNDEALTHAAHGLYLIRNK